MNQLLQGTCCHGVFMEGELMVLGGTSGRAGKIFDPPAGTWRKWDLEGIRRIVNKSVSRKSVLAASCTGNLYVFQGQHVMEYDRQKNVWTNAAFLWQRPNYFITCATQWRDCIFVSTCGIIPQSKHISYLFNPSTRRWIEVKGDGGGMIVCATTLEI